MQYEIQLQLTGLDEATYNSIIQLTQTLKNVSYQPLTPEAKKEQFNKYKEAINEIENAMERWHHARDNDDETLDKINSILVGLGKLEWFNSNNIKNQKNIQDDTDRENLFSSEIK